MDSIKSKEFDVQIKKLLEKDYDAGLKIMNFWLY